MTFSISQSAKKIRGDFPPSSREHFFRFESAQDLCIYHLYHPDSDDLDPDPDDRDDSDPDDRPDHDPDDRPDHDPGGDKVGCGVDNESYDGVVDWMQMTVGDDGGL